METIAHIFPFVKWTIFLKILKISYDWSKNSTEGFLKSPNITNNYTFLHHISKMLYVVHILITTYYWLSILFLQNEYSIPSSIYENTYFWYRCKMRFTFIFFDKPSLSFWGVIIGDKFSLFVDFVDVRKSGTTASSINKIYI